MLDDGTSASTAHKLRLLFIFLNVNAQKQIDAHAVCSVRIVAAPKTRCAEGLQPVPSLLRRAVAALPCLALPCRANIDRSASSLRRDYLPAEPLPIALQYVVGRSVGLGLRTSVRFYHSASLPMSVGGH
jgi:hypothetical protein